MLDGCSGATSTHGCCSFLATLPWLRRVAVAVADSVTVAVAVAVSFAVAAAVAVAVTVAAVAIAVSVAVAVPVAVAVAAAAVVFTIPVQQHGITHNTLTLHSFPVYLPPYNSFTLAFRSLI